MYSRSSVVWSVPGSSVARVTGTPAASISRTGCSSIEATARVRRLDVMHTSTAMPRSARCTSRRGSFVALVPAVTAAMDYAFLGNRLPPMSLAGMAAILLGVALVFRTRAIAPRRGSSG